MARRSTGYIVTSSGKKKLRGVNIKLGKKRTSVRLSPAFAHAIEKIAEREHCTLNELYGYIVRRKKKGVGRSTAIRNFVVRYFMDAATEAGHRKAGHGKLVGKAKRGS
jgi:predicted DNA-binding ribbon-helix-helix protein